MSILGFEVEFINILILLCILNVLAVGYYFAVELSNAERLIGCVVWRELLNVGMS